MPLDYVEDNGVVDYENMGEPTPIAKAIEISAGLELVQRERFELEAKFEQALADAEKHLVGELADHCTTLGLDPVKVGKAAKQQMDQAAAGVVQQAAEDEKTPNVTQPAPAKAEAKPAVKGPFCFVGDASLVYSGKGPLPVWMKQKLNAAGIDWADKSKEAKAKIQNWKERNLVPA